jgi:prepilin-type N-terminal cleavage/methylation domain-containing protein
MNAFRPTTRQSGFTLLEVLIAVVILSLSFVASLKGFYQAQRAGIRSAQLNTVALLAQSKMEEILNDPFARDEGRFEDHPDVQWKVERETMDLGLDTQFTLVRLRLYWSNAERDKMILEQLLYKEQAP